VLPLDSSASDRYRGSRYRGSIVNSEEGWKRRQRFSHLRPYEFTTAITMDEACRLTKDVVANHRLRWIPCRLHRQGRPLHIAEAEGKTCGVVQGHKIGVLEPINCKYALITIIAVIFVMLKRPCCHLPDRLHFAHDEAGVEKTRLWVVIAT